MYSILPAPLISHDIPVLHGEAKRSSDDITVSKKKVMQQVLKETCIEREYTKIAIADLPLVAWLFLATHQCVSGSEDKKSIISA